MKVGNSEETSVAIPNKLAIPNCRRNVTKRWKRRLKGSPCQPGIVSQLQPASSPTIYRSLCRKDKTRRGEPREERSRTNYANWRLSCSTLIPGSKMTRPEFFCACVRYRSGARLGIDVRTGAAFHYLRRCLVIIRPIIPV